MSKTKKKVAAKKSKSPAITDNSVFEKSSDAVYRNLDENTVTIISLNDPEFYFKIDAYAAQAWVMIDGKKTIKEISSSLQKQSGAPASIVLKHVNKLFSDLISYGLITSIS